MAVPYTFANATVSIPLSQLDDNFDTPITLGNTAIELGNTVTTLNNMTLANVTVSSGNATFTTANVTNMSSSNVTITGGTIANVTISGSGSNITATNINASNVTVSTDLTLSGGAATGVLYLNGSRAVTSGSALTFDGTNVFRVTNGSSGFYKAFSGEIVVGEDASGMYFGTGSGLAPSVPMYFGSAGTTFQRWQAGGSEQMRLTSTGLGIGTSSPAGKLTLGGSGALQQYFISSSATAQDNAIVSLYNNGSAYSQLTHDAAYYTWSTSGTERMRIDSSGNLFINGTSVPYSGYGAKLVVNSSLGSGQYTITSVVNSTAGQGHINFVNNNGNVGHIDTSGSSTTYATSSDYRLKENIQPMQNALGVVQQLNPVTYTWKSDGSDGQGFIAHELQAVVPDCVTGEKDAVDAEGNPVYQGIDTSFLVATLTKAIQEQQEQINQLKAEVAALKGN